MSKNRKLTDFFRPAAQSKPNSVSGNGGSKNETGKAATKGSITLKTSYTEESLFSGSGRSLDGATTYPDNRTGASSSSGKNLKTFQGRLAEPSGDSLGEQKIKGQEKSKGSYHDGFGEDKMDIDHENENDVGKEEPASKNLLIIRSSDDEEDSDSSLEDIDTIFKTHRPSTGGENQQRTSSKWTNSLEKAVQKKFNLPKSPEIPVYTISMDELVQAAEKDRALDAKIDSIRATSKISSKDVSMTNESSVEKGHLINNDLLASVVGEDSEQGGMTKVMNAISRTEALNKDLVWYFFNENERPEEMLELPFPQSSIPEAAWKRAILAGK